MQQDTLLKCSEETRRLLVGLDKLQRKLLMNNNSVNEEAVEDEQQSSSQ